MPASPRLPEDLTPQARLYVRPHPVVPDPAVEHGLDGMGCRSLAGGSHAFAGCEVLVRDGDRIMSYDVSFRELDAWKDALVPPQRLTVDSQLQRMSSARPPLAGLHWDRPILMGVINMTPDSFYSGSQAPSVSAARDAALAMVEAGADIVDVGGESTRPGGAEPVSVEEELSRVIPLVEALARLPVPVSLDTRHAEVMLQGVGAGAAVINDINALNGEGCLEVAAKTGVPVILMHCPADFAAMHKPTSYDHVALEVFDWLEQRLEACEAAGIRRESLIVDPGIGFVKQATQSAAALARVSLLHSLGCPVLVGASRKSFIGRLAGGDTADDRLPGSLAAALWAAGQGVQILRVHDVAETRQAIALQSAIESGLTEVC